MWQSYVKNALMLTNMLSFLLLAHALTVITQGYIQTGSLLLFIAIFLGVASFSVAYYWHKHDIHVTPAGTIASLLFFAAGVVWLWLYESYFKE